MNKFTIALREIGTYKEVLRSQVLHLSFVLVYASCEAFYKLLCSLLIPHEVLIILTRILVYIGCFAVVLLVCYIASLLSFSNTRDVLLHSSFQLGM